MSQNQPMTSPDGFRTTDSKIVSIESARTFIRESQAQDKTVVFTNGCFDVPHVGHARSIVDAAVLGDFLVVGINDDAAVRELKGPGRPLQPQEERSRLIAAMRDVDLVVIFPGRTADKLLDDLRPDIHAKGTDYDKATVPERDTVLGYGGKIAITGDPKNHATKDLIREVRRRFGSGDGDA